MGRGPPPLPGPAPNHRPASKAGISDLQRVASKLARLWCDQSHAPRWSQGVRIDPFTPCPSTPFTPTPTPRGRGLGAPGILEGQASDHALKKKAWGAQGRKRQLGTRSPTPHVLFPDERGSCWLFWPCRQFYLALSGVAKKSEWHGVGVRRVLLCHPSPFPPGFHFPCLDICHSVDRVISVEGTQRAKKHLVPGTQTL